SDVCSSDLDSGRVVLAGCRKRLLQPSSRCLCTTSLLLPLRREVPGVRGKRRSPRRAVVVAAGDVEGRKYDLRLHPHGVLDVDGVRRIIGLGKDLLLPTT